MILVKLGEATDLFQQQMNGAIADANQLKVQRRRLAVGVLHARRRTRRQLHPPPPPPASRS